MRFGVSILVSSRLASLFAIKLILVIFYLFIPSFLPNLSAPTSRRSHITSPCAHSFFSAFLVTYRSFAVISSSRRVRPFICFRVFFRNGDGLRIFPFTMKIEVNALQYEPLFSYIILLVKKITAAAGWSWWMLNAVLSRFSALDDPCMLPTARND